MHMEWLGGVFIVAVLAGAYIIIEVLRGSSAKASSRDQGSPALDDSLLFIQMRAEHEKKLLSMTSIQRQKYLKVNPHPFKGHLFCFSNKIVDVAQDGDDGYSVLLGVNSSRYEDDLYYLFVNFKSRNPAAGDLNKGQMIWVRGYAAKLERESDRVELEDRSYKIYQFTLTVKDFRWGVIGGVGIFN